MRILYTSIVLLTAFLNLGCGDSQSALQKARQVGVPTLRSNLQALVASPAGQMHEIASAAWPPSVREMGPESVQLHMDGVLLVYGRSSRAQEGLLVMLDATTDPGAGGSGVSYRSLGDGLYWCSEKIRVAARRSHRIHE